MGKIPTLERMPPAVTAQAMRRLDLWAMHEFQVPLLLMMDQAGRAMAELVARRFSPGRSDPILVLAGKGGNGGGALASARHLLHRGYTVQARTTDTLAKLTEETRRHLSMYRKEGGSAPPHQRGEALPAANWIIDGILGYGITDSPKGSAADLISAANDAKATVVALDVPSGLNPDTGQATAATVEADATLTLALPKAGLLEPEAGPYVGELYLGDIGFPRPLYRDFDVRPEDLFLDGPVVRLPDPRRT